MSKRGTVASTDLECGNKVDGLKDMMQTSLHTRNEGELVTMFINADD